MELSGRNFVGDYLFGYQVSMTANEVGNGNYTTEFRQLRTDLGQWLSRDPVFQPWQSPYNSMDGNPVSLTDRRGTNTVSTQTKGEPKNVERLPTKSGIGRIDYGGKRNQNKKEDFPTNDEDHNEVRVATILLRQVRTDVISPNTGSKREKIRGMTKSEAPSQSSQQKRKSPDPVPPDGIYYSKWVLDFTWLQRLLGGNNLHGVSYTFAIGGKIKWLGWRKDKTIKFDGKIWGQC